MFLSSLNTAKSLLRGRRWWLTIATISDCVSYHALTLTDNRQSNMDLWRLLTLFALVSWHFVLYFRSHSSTELQMKFLYIYIYPSVILMIMLFFKKQLSLLSLCLRFFMINYLACHVTSMPIYSNFLKRSQAIKWSLLKIKSLFCTSLHSSLVLSLEYIKKVAITVVYLETEIKYESRDFATNTEYGHISSFATHSKLI